VKKNDGTDFKPENLLAENCEAVVKAFKKAFT